MAKEALDIKELDTLVLATPVGSIEQATGRILRMCESKKDPIVVDPWDTGLWVDNLRKYRNFSYSRLGYTVLRGK